MFGDSLTTIEHRAFGYCGKLTTLTFPESLTTIGSNAFINCDSLKTVYLPDNVTQWDTSPFEGCYYGNLTKFYCTPGSATAYGLSEHHCAFTDPKNPTWAWSYGEDGSLYVGGYNGTSTSITLPSSAKGIKKYAFYNDEKLTKVVVPEGIEHIGKEAFYSCSAMKSITLPASVNRIDEGGLGWHATVSVPAGSYAESYCKENDIEYVTR